MRAMPKWSSPRAGRRYPCAAVQVALAVGLGACSARDLSLGAYETTSGASATGEGEVTAAVTATGVATEGSEAGGTGPLLDVGSALDLGVVTCTDPDDPACDCTAVDILFVIENSGSMCFRQESLAQAFLGFVDAMQESLPVGTDLHVGITTSAFSLGGSYVEENCVPQATAQEIAANYIPPTEAMLDGNGLQGRLFEHEGKRWFAVDTADAAGMAELETWFSGAATAVGCGTASYAFNAAGAAWALHPTNAATNAGFLRDEKTALLLFILTDGADQSLDVESLAFLHDTVVAAKAGCGGDECIVSGGLFLDLCTPDENATWDFLLSFGEEPIWEDLGIWVNPFEPPPDYSDTVGLALAQVVAQQCANIPPQG